MADATTTNYSLTKPEVGASNDTWGDKLNDNFDDIDSLLGGGTAVAGINITSGTISGITDLAVADGGTGASTASGARTNLGLAIGTNVQAYDAQLTDIAGLTPSDGYFIVGNGSNFVTETGNTALASIGVTATTTELNKLDGVTASTAELNYVDGVTSNIQTQLDGKITAVTASTGLSGGGSSGSVSLSLATAGIGAGTYGSTSDGTKIDTITVDAYGRITAVATGTTGSSSTTGTVTSVSGGTGLTGTVTTSGSISIASNGVGATQLNVSGNGTTSQFLRSDGDGSFTWATPTNTTYTAGAGLDLSSTTFSVESDLRSDAWQIGRDTSDYYIVNTTSHDWYLDGNLDMKLENDGDLHVDGDVVAYSTTTSDAKFKDNVTVIENALDKVNQLRGVEFDWNATSRKGSHDIGLIAQEVEKIIPYIVREKTLQTGEFESSPIQAKTIDYEKLVAVLIEAVKELSEKVKKLEES